AATPSPGSPCRAASPVSTCRTQPRSRFTWRARSSPIRREASSLPALSPRKSGLSHVARPLFSSLLASEPAGSGRGFATHNVPSLLKSIRWVSGRSVSLLMDRRSGAPPCGAPRADPSEKECMIGEEAHDDNDHESREEQWWDDRRRTSCRLRLVAWHRI